MIRRLIESIKEKKAPICVGLDPLLSFIPEWIKKEAIEHYGYSFKAAAEAVVVFNKGIIDGVAPLVPAVKPQLAMYEQFGVEGLKAYSETISYAKNKGLIVIADGKRGDIGSTSGAYALAHLGKTDVFGKKISAFEADMLTVNPYLGSDGILPFVEVCKENDKGLFVLVKTSNPSSGEFQDRLIDKEPLYRHVAKKVMEWGANSLEFCGEEEAGAGAEGMYSNIGAVVGATYPEIAKELRALMPGVFFLVPGYGAQGGSAEDLSHCFDKNGMGAIVNSSRGIIAAYQQKKYADFGSEGFAEAAREAVFDMAADLSRVIG